VILINEKSNKDIMTNNLNNHRRSELVVSKANESRNQETSPQQFEKYKARTDIY